MAARRAFESGVWAQQHPRERKRVLLRFAELILEHRDELALLETLDMGKPISDSLAVDKLIHIDESNSYFRMIRTTWGQRLRQVFDSIPEPSWTGQDADLSSQVPTQAQAMNPLGKIRAPQG